MNKKQVAREYAAKDAADRAQAEALVESLTLPEHKPSARPGRRDAVLEGRAAAREAEADWEAGE